MTLLVDGFLRRPWAEALHLALRATKREKLPVVEPIAVGLFIARGANITGTGWREIDDVERDLSRRFFKRAARQSTAGVRRLHVWLEEERWDAMLAASVAAIWSSGLGTEGHPGWEGVEWGLERLRVGRGRSRSDDRIRQIDAICRVAALPPDDSECSHAVAELEAMTARGSPSARAIAHLGLADAAQRGGRVVDGLERIDRAVAVIPESALLHRLAGHAHMHAGDIDGAHERYLRALRLLGRDPKNHLALARLQIEIGEIDRAADTLQAMPPAPMGEVEQARTDGERAMLLSTVAERNGRIHEARGLIGFAIERFEPLARRADIGEAIRRLGGVWLPAPRRATVGSRGAPATQSLPSRAHWPAGPSPSLVFRGLARGGPADPPAVTADGGGSVPSVQENVRRRVETRALAHPMTLKKKTR